jgi:hypothetical protein
VVPEIRVELGDPVPKEPKKPEEPGLRATLPVPARPVVQPDPADPELNEYNDYLAWLSANPDLKPADYRRAPAAAADTPIRISDRRPD